MPVRTLLGSPRALRRPHALSRIYTSLVHGILVTEDGSYGKASEVNLTGTLAGGLDGRQMGRVRIRGVRIPDTPEDVGPAWDDSSRAGGLRCSCPSAWPWVDLRLAWNGSC